MTDSRAMTLRDLLHLVDRARRGTILAPEIDDLHAGITFLDTKVAALEAGYEGVATAAMAHRWCFMRENGLLLRAEKAEAAVTRVGAALDAAEWGGPDRHDVIVEIRAALVEPKAADR